MKKIILTILLMFIPYVIYAKTIKDYDVTSAQHVMEREGIKYDIGDFKENSKQIPLYLFHGEGCSHCYEFLTYVASSLVKDYGNMFTVKAFEVWNNPENNELMNSVAASLGYEKDEIGVPFIVIGNKTFVGYASSMNNGIINQIKTEYNRDKHEDKVQEVISNLSNNNSETKSDDKQSSNEKQEQSDTKNEESQTSSFSLDSSIVWYVIFGAIIVFVVLFFRGTK